MKNRNDTGVYNPSTKFLGLFFECVDGNKNKDVTRARLFTYMKNSGNKVSANDISFIVNELSESDKDRTKKMISAINLVIRSLSNKRRKLFKFEHFPYRRHYLQLFSNAENDFDINYARKAIEKCFILNPIAIDKLKKSFEVYDFPCLDENLNKLYFMPGHHYAVYQGLLRRENFLKKVISNILMNYYDTIDELCWVLNNALSYFEDADDQYNDHLLQNVEGIEYLGHLIGYAPEKLEPYLIPDDPSLKSYLRYFEDYIDDSEVFSLRHELSPSIMQFMIDKWPKIIEQRKLYEQDIDGSFLEKFRKFAYLVYCLDWEIRTNRSLLEEAFGLTNIIPRLLIKHHSNPFWLEQKPEFEKDKLFVVEKFGYLSKILNVRILGDLTEFLIFDQKDIRQIKSGMIKFYLSIHYNIDSGLKGEENNPEFDRVRCEFLEAIQQIASYCGLESNVTKGLPFFEFNINGYWRRCYPQERYSVDKAMELVKSSRHEPDAFVVHSRYALETLGIIKFARDVENDFLYRNSANSDGNGEVYVMSIDCLDSYVFDGDEDDDDEDDEELE